MSLIDEMKVKFTAETAQFTERVNGATRSLNNLPKASRGIDLTRVAIAGLGAAAVTAGAALYKLVSITMDGLKAFEETERYMARTEAQLKATGAAVGYTSGELDAFARSVAMNTLASTDGIRSAMSVLMSFKSITGETFKKTISLAQDMAEVFGRDVAREARTLGRALQEPAEAANILKAAGLELSDSQKELIKDFVEAGDKAKAQEIILTELQNRVGGAGTAAAQGTVSGALDTLSQVTTEVGEEFAKTTGLTDIFKKSINGLSSAFAELLKIMKGVDTKTYVSNLEKQVEILEKAKRGLEEQVNSGSYGDGVSDSLKHINDELVRAKAALAEGRKKLSKQEAEAAEKEREANEAKERAEQAEREKAGEASLNRVNNKLKTAKEKIDEARKADLKTIDNMQLSADKIKELHYSSLEELKKAYKKKINDKYDEEERKLAQHLSKKTGAKKKAAKSSAISQLATLDMQYADERQKLDLHHQQQMQKIAKMNISVKEARERGFSSVLELRKYYFSLENQAYEKAIQKHKEKLEKADKDKKEKIRKFMNEIRGMGNDPYTENDIRRDDMTAKAKEMLDQQLIDHDQFVKAKEAIDDEYRKRKEQLDREAVANQLNAMGSLFEGLAGMAEAYGGRNSAMFRTMFALSKSFKIAESLLHLHSAVIKALDAPEGTSTTEKFANMAAVA
ncbi:phage tail length tape measure family protein, partial [Pasteurellaceae bacterium TAE3-ERU1]|nr:phage tail length tape measure family protein [Pasteurellaceae bacterium TAE3-ERU1]